MMGKLTSKLVAVMNKSVEPGVAMNALAHASLGLGAALGPELVELIEYTDASGGRYPNISKIPYIILRGGGNKIRQLYEEANARGITCVAFTDTMTVGMWEEQLERSAKTAFEELTFYGVVLFGEWDSVTELTRKFSLWK